MKSNNTQKKSNMKKQSGFAALEAILILVILAIIGFTGWYVWHSRQNTNKTLSETGNSTVQKPATAITNFAECEKAPGSHTLAVSPEVCVAQDGKSFTEPLSPQYLVIKEWGVKLPLSSDDHQAYYTYWPMTSDSLTDAISIFDKGIDVTKNANGVSCKDKNYPLFVINRVKKSDVAKTSDPDSPYFIEETNIGMYKSFAFAKNYEFIGRSIHQATPACEYLNSTGVTKLDSTVDQEYTRVWRALELSYEQMQGE